MTRAVEGFTGLEHALEPVTEIGGVRFVNDSKATNVEAARRAIESFGAGLVAIMGGRFKGGDLTDLVTPLKERGATVIAIGEGAAFMRRLAEASRCDASDARRRTAFNRFARQCGRARSCVRELRHVPRLRRARACVQARGGAAREGVERRA
jgi:UDP-N-acetylmuramoylalanine-D-glutamate ligase